MIDWSPLRSELRAWRAADLRLPFWWRDDDAVEASHALERLSEMGQETELPIHLAVIPEFCTPGFAKYFADVNFRVVVHGFAHVNHAPADMKKSEFGVFRRDGSTDLRRSSKLLSEKLPSLVYPMFVPPWNRIDPGYLSELHDCGFDFLSTFQPRHAKFAAPGIVQVNTHIDPIDWRGSRSLVEPEDVIARVVANLQDRRAGRTDNEEPLGYLTHHLVHDEAIWEFSKAFLIEMREGPVDLFDISDHCDAK